jgi:hypothetical protein
MKWLYSDILKEKKALKSLVILLVTVNAIVLAVLLFGPSKKPDASVRKPENASGSNQSGMVLNTSEEADIEENKSDSEADNLEADTGSEEAGAEENLPGSEEEDFRTQGDPEEEPDQAEDPYDNENPNNTEDLYNEGNLNNTEETEGTAANAENDTAYGSDTEQAPGSGPVLELTDEHITLRVGEEFDYYKYIKTMEDRDGSSLSRYIHLSQIVNTWIPGDYTVTYRITSPIDGQSVSKDLLVTVE